MYISCPKCGVQFNIEAKKIGLYGDKVKCSNCLHIWHYGFNKEKIPPIITTTNNTEDISDNKTEINLPALMPEKIPLYLYALPFLIIGCIIFMATIIFAPLEWINSILNNTDLMINDVKIDHQKESSKIIITYKILNSSSEPIKIPLVRIRLLDQSNRIIKSKIDNHKHINIGPNQHIHISSEFYPIPKTVDNVDIMLGNKIDFLLR